MSPTIRNTHSDHANLVGTVLFQQLKQGGTETAGQVGFFDGHNQPFSLRQSEQQLGIERLYESGVHHRRFRFFLCQILGGLQRGGTIEP